MPESSIRPTPRPGGGHRFRPEEGTEDRVLVADDSTGERELGRVSGDGSSILMADGQLFRVAVRGLSSPRVEVARWDVPGPYVVARPTEAGWRLERTPAGRELEGCETLEVLVTAAIEALEGR